MKLGIDSNAKKYHKLYLTLIISVFCYGLGFGRTQRKMKSSMLKRTWLLLHRQQSKRLLSSVQNNIFDRNLKKRHRKNHLNSPDSQYYNYLREESNRRLIDRIDDINKTFPFGLEIGSHSGNLYTLINSYPSLRSDNGGVGGIERLLLCDSTVGANWPCNATTAPIVSPLPVLCDEEYLPFKESTFDIVLSSLYLHWSNDLETVMNNVYKVLKPDGVFIASILGNNTLKELQDCFYFAENERRGGMSFHTSPFARPSDIAGLMQAANFNLPTVDIDTITVRTL